MPKTKLQSVVFTLMMVFCMVFCMTVYTISIQMKGLSYQAISLAIREMWIEYIIVFCLIYFIITKLAVKLAGRIVQPGSMQPIFSIISVQCMTVSLIVPTITLIATFLHNGFTSNWFTLWIQQAFLCFPAALCLQVFYVGPLVRFIFRHLFPAK